MNVVSEKELYPLICVIYLSDVIACC